MTTYPPAAAPQWRRVPTPSWAAQALTWAAELPDADVTRAVAQQGAAVRAVDEALHFALSAPEPQRTFRWAFRVHEGISGAYFLGRRHLSPLGGAQVLMETECCLLRRGLPGRDVEVDTRFKVTLQWDLSLAQGVWELPRLLEVVGGQLARLDGVWLAGALCDLGLRRVGPSSLEHIRALSHSNMPPELLARVEGRWEAALADIHRGAQQAIDDESGDGELPYATFPCRLDLTGEYIVESVQDWSEGNADHICVALHFQGHPRYDGQMDFGFLSMDVEFGLDDQGAWVYSGHHTGVIMS